MSSAWAEPRTAIVTGGGSGIGLAIARRLADDGAGGNLTGTFHVCQATVPHMIDAGWGRIVNISSSSAQTGNPLMTRYSAAKAGVVGAGVETHEQTTPVRRVGRPENVAAACAFLVRDEAGYITGQVLGVNGGRTTS